MRYQLSNLYDFDPAKHSVPDDKLTGLDRWILSEFSKLEQEVIEAYDKYEFHVVYQKVSQFVAVELSSIYHDVIKDRLYTDAANSHRRRSTQTTLYRLVTGVCQMLSPILAFTADEAWEFVPGRTTDSVHSIVWNASNQKRVAASDEAWGKLFELRELVLLELEKARQAKLIGKALDAKIFIPFTAKTERVDLWSFAVGRTETFQELLNLSSLTIWKYDEEELPLGVAEVLSKQDFDQLHSDNSNGYLIKVLHADGQKCERCWHWETDVGLQKEHPTLCARCVQAIR